MERSKGSIVKGKLCVVVVLVGGSGSGKVRVGVESSVVGVEKLLR